MNQTPSVSWPLRHRGRLACTRSLEPGRDGAALAPGADQLLHVRVLPPRRAAAAPDAASAVAAAAALAAAALAPAALALAAAALAPAALSVDAVTVGVKGSWS